MPSYKTKNDFYKGLNQDIGTDKFQNQFYYYMLNGSIVTDKGLTTGNPTNISGNKLFAQLPNTFNLWRGYINSEDTTTPGNLYGFDLHIAAITLTFSGTYSSKEDLFQEIKDAIQANYILSTVLQIHVSYNNTEITIWSTINNVTIFVDNYTEPTNQLAFPVLPNIPAQQNLKIIGWGLIRDDIYILSTNGNTIPGTFGQIWKLTYSKLTLVPVLTLVLNANLNFTLLHPFPNPGGVIGIYENDKIQRLYLTDNYNSVRGINVKDPDLMSVDPTLFDLSPAVSFDIPILNIVQKDGNVETGVYQACYRLSNSRGAATKISSPSNIVSIVPQSEQESTSGNKFVEYVGASKGTPASKSITWTINKIDADFDQIEIVILKTTTKNQVPEILLLPAQPITNSNNYSFTYYGNEPITTLTLQEFNALSGVFTHCKSIAVKDSILFAANTRREQKELNFDARAYRANSTGIFNVQNGSTMVDITGNFATVPETADTINPAQNVYKYRLNPATSAYDLLGGEGTNIKYQFGTLAIKADSTIAFGTEISSTQPSTVYHSNPNFNITNLSLQVPNINETSFQNYPDNNINSGTKFVYYSSLLRDYQRKEVYRLAFQAYDLSGNPFFAKWIGDIEFPDIYDPNPKSIFEDGTPTGYDDFRLTLQLPRGGGPSEAYTNHLFIEFEVTLPEEVRRQISGYNIVRVQRTESDKTILTTGLLNPTQMGGSLATGSSLDIYPPYPGPLDFLATNNTYMNTLGDAFTLGGHGNERTFTFDSPDFLLEGFPGYRQGDQIIICAKVSPSAYASLNISGSVLPINEQFQMCKWYDFQPIGGASPNSYEIGIAQELVLGQSIKLAQSSTLTGYTFHNFMREMSGDIFHTTDNGSAYGSKTLFIGFDSTITAPLQYFTNYACTLANGNKLLAYYYRFNANQYGGKTYSARTLNEYIDCSGFRPVNPKLGTVVQDTIKVFGGDCYTSIYDNQKAIKFWDNDNQVLLNAGVQPVIDGIGIIDNNGDIKRSFSMIFPTQTTCNPNLRYGTHPNSAIFANLGNISGATPDTSVRETYDYNSVYDSENNTRTYFPKPLEFLANDINDNRIYASEPKISGEIRDSWTVFQPNNYIDVDAIFGPINQLINFNNTLLFWQDKAYGTVSVNERSLIQDASGSGLALGSGGVLDRRDYISSTIGSKHQFSFAEGPESVFWLDILQQRFYTHSNKGLQQLDGLNGYLNNHLINSILTSDNPYTGSGCTSTYDYNFDQFITTVNNFDFSQDPPERGFTLSYSEKIDSFHSFYSYFTPVFINDKQNFFHIKDKQLWIANEGDYGSFFGVTHPFTIYFIVNEQPGVEKRFDNLELNTTAFIKGQIQLDDIPLSIDQKLITFDEYRIFNSYQNTNWIPLDQDNIRRVKRTWNIKIRGNAVKYNTALGVTNYNIFDNTNLWSYPQRDALPSRLKSAYVFVNLKYNNTSNNRLTLENCLTTYALNSSKPIKLLT